MDYSKLSNEDKLKADLLIFGVCYKNLDGEWIDARTVRVRESDNSFVILKENNKIEPIACIAEYL